jgi:hypothetical protein
MNLSNVKGFVEACLVKRGLARYFSYPSLSTNPVHLYHFFHSQLVSCHCHYE